MTALLWLEVLCLRIIKIDLLRYEREQKTYLGYFGPKDNQKLKS